MSALVSELTTQGSRHTLTPLPFQHDPARSRVEGIGLGEMVRERAERGGGGGCSGVITSTYSGPSSISA